MALDRAFGGGGAPLEEKTCQRFAPGFLSIAESAH
jgi:hypothetical protein